MKLPFAALAAGLALCATAGAQVTQRVSVTSLGQQANNHSLATSLSSDGRIVAFQSRSTDLLPSDTSTNWDVFVRDHLLGQTEIVSVDSNGVPGNGDSQGGWMSDDGRFVSYSSNATNLVPGDNNGTSDAFLRDRLTGTTELISISSSGAQANAYSLGLGVTPDGRYVGLVSFATNLDPLSLPVPGQTFLRDRMVGTTELVSIGLGGAAPNGDATGFSISADGRFVAFSSRATNLVAADTNGALSDVFVRDRQTGTTELVSKSSAGLQGNGASNNAKISPDGRYVTFVSLSDVLVDGDTNGVYDVFLRDRLTGSTERVSLSSTGVEANNACDGGDPLW